jgi:hypothetical protein
MGQTEQVYKWEVDGLRRRLESLEERLDNQSQARFRAWTTFLWMFYAAGLTGMLVAAALS